MVWKTSDVFNWSKAQYSKDFFLGKRERSCLPACPFDLEDGHLTLDKSVVFHLSSNSVLAENFHHKGLLLPFVRREKVH